MAEEPDHVREAPILPAHSSDQLRLWTSNDWVMCVHESARELLRDWMLNRIEQIARAAVEFARARDLEMRGMHLIGTTFEDDGDSQLTLQVAVRADEDESYAYWKQLAERAYEITAAAPSVPAGEDSIRIDVAVMWDADAVQS